MTEIHADGADGMDYTLCGVAQDAFESGDCSSPVLIAEPAQYVTCQQCIAIINHVRAMFTQKYRARRA